MKVSMLRSIGLGLLVAAGLAWTAPATRADDTEDNNGLSVTVAFGSGLNTLPPPPQLSGPPITTFCRLKSSSAKTALCTSW